MILPDKEYLRIEEVAARWRNTTEIPVRDVDIFDYIKQGVLPAYILHKGTYYLVPDSELSSFDGYIGDMASGHIIFKNCPFVPPEKNLFDKTVRAPDVRVDTQDVYVKQIDLTEYEKNANGNGSAPSRNDEKLNTVPEKPFGTVERKSLHQMIVALVELAELNNEPDYAIANDIVCKVNLSPNTVVNHLRAAYETKRKCDELKKR